MSRVVSTEMRFCWMATSRVRRIFLTVEVLERESLGGLVLPAPPVMGAIEKPPLVCRAGSPYSGPGCSPL